MKDMTIEKLNRQLNESEALNTALLNKVEELALEIGRLRFLLGQCGAAEKAKPQPQQCQPRVIKVDFTRR